MHFDLGYFQIKTGLLGHHPNGRWMKMPRPIYVFPRSIVWECSCDSISPTSSQDDGRGSAPAELTAKTQSNKQKPCMHPLSCDTARISSSLAISALPSKQDWTGSSRTSLVKFSESYVRKSKIIFPNFFIHLFLVMQADFHPLYSLFPLKLWEWDMGHPQVIPGEFLLQHQKGWFTFEKCWVTQLSLPFEEGVRAGVGFLTAECLLNAILPWEVAEGYKAHLNFVK